MDVQMIGYCLTAAVLLAVSIAGFSGSRSRVAGMCRAEGVVLGDQQADHEVNVWAPIIRFRTNDGQVVEFIERGFSQIRRATGRRVSVLYSPKNPRNARLADFQALYGMPVACLLISLLLCIGAIWRQG